ncbi:MAG: F0F1 ATP synthase subunit B [Deltaproteobacteria bacterium]|nr:F0F1 ATP synthase subunit B [Deltaproteobacteria bacterium]
MLIDWFTVAAQIVNFLILVALLKHFLYNRIVAAMDKRKQSIAGRMEEAEKKKKEAEEEKRKFERKNRELEQAKESLIAQARQEAEQEKRKLLKNAKKEVDQKRERWTQSLQNEQQNFLASLTDLARSMVPDMARAVIADLADKQLEQQAVERFAAQLENLDAERRDAFARAAAADENQVVAKTAFDLSEESKDRLKKAVADHLAREAEVEFETIPSLVLGIELSARGQKIAWSATDYLGELARAAHKEFFAPAAQEQQQAQRLKADAQKGAPEGGPGMEKERKEKEVSAPGKGS